jgi:soluble lytic murein transglycosylase-like protein
MIAWNWRTASSAMLIALVAGLSASSDAKCLADSAVLSLMGHDPASYRAIAATEAKHAGLPPEIADSVMAVESGYNPDAIGTSGEIGLMQILPTTAEMLGFVGTAADLAVPETNIHYGVTYLAAAWHLADEDLCTAVMKYRAGHGETRFSYRSVDYCLAVRRQLRERGYPVTGVVPIPTFGEADGCSLGCGGSRRHFGFGLGKNSQIDLAALNSKLNDIAIHVVVRAVSAP